MYPLFRTISSTFSSYRLRTSIISSTIKDNVLVFIEFYLIGSHSLLFIWSLFCPSGGILVFAPMIIQVNQNTRCSDDPPQSSSCSHDKSTNSDFNAESLSQARAVLRGKRVRSITFPFFISFDKFVARE